MDTYIDQPTTGQLRVLLGALPYDALVVGIDKSVYQIDNLLVKIIRIYPIEENGDDPNYPACWSGFCDYDAQTIEDAHGNEYPVPPNAVVAVGVFVG